MSYEFWEETLEYMRSSLMEVSFSTFVKPLYVHHVDEDAGVVFLAWPGNDQLIHHVKNRYLDKIESAINDNRKSKYRVTIKAEKELNRADPVETRENANDINKLKLEKLFNPRFSFENFVIGKSNQFAHAVSLAVAETPGEIYNPLFIYGDSGLGKTHLMQAIGLHIIRNNPSAKVLYTSSEMFTNELITSLNKKNPRLFRNKYRKLDVLLIDDIQFLEGKTATQEEFFHTFDELYQNNKQIVITSDRPPSELRGLDERLVTRFGWNMVADIQHPDYETRVAILEHFASKTGLEITQDVYDVLCLIAEKLSDNIRELQGAFNRVVAFSKMMDTEINVDTAKDILKDIFGKDSQAVMPERIRNEVARYYSVKKSDMDSGKRNADIAMPRMVAMYLIRENTDISFSNIGKLFGGRHYATVMHAVEKIEKAAKQDMKLQQDIKSIMEKVKRNI
ncbi:MAG: chromosomal replication initiator protein DnaA [Mogibacterium sp.]|nr:chromosomal replication initiator protein DnaA [Mogibacterium sp.]